MGYRVLGLVCAIGIIYLIGIAALDPRMEDGGLYFDEMHPWEHLLIPVTFLGILALWIRGMVWAVKRGIAVFLLALMIWPYGVFLALRGSH